MLERLCPLGKQTGSDKNCFPLKIWLNMMEVYSNTLNTLPLVKWLEHLNYDAKSCQKVVRLNLDLLIWAPLIKASLA